MKRAAFWFAKLLTALLVAIPALAAPLLSDSGSARKGLNESPAREKVLAGHEALAKQEFNKAELLFKSAAELDAKSPHPALGMAELARIRNQPKDVQAWLKTALKVAPNSSDALVAWARWLYSSRQFKDAEKQWLQAIKENPEATTPLVDLGDMYYNNYSKPEVAAEYYKKALAINPQLGGAHYALGMTHVARRDAELAISEFTEAARLSPGNPLPHHAMGRAYQLQNDPNMALTAFDRALEIEPNYYVARLDKADVLANLNRLDQALVEILAVTKAQPKNPTVHIKLGMLYQRMKMPDEARAAYLVATQADPRAALAYNNLAWISAERKTQLDEALQWANKAVELAPEVVAFQDTLGWVLATRGEYEKAISVLEKAAATKNGQTFDIYFHLGIAYSQNGRKDEALAALRKATQLSKTSSNTEKTRKMIKELDQK